MAVLDMTLLTATAVLIGLVTTCLLCLDRTQVRRTWTELGQRLRSVAPYLGVAALFFLLKRATHEQSVQISRELDWDLTAGIYAIEGEFVAMMQNVIPDQTIAFFSAMYMFGFPFLLVTAPILYLLLPSQRRLKELLIAYVLNYVIGTILYTLFVVYGPRNHLSSVSGLMYDFYPQTQDLTAAVSSNTNVFPSLHTSLAIVVLILAWRSRREYPRWLGISTFVVSCVVFSTMYLGIHWVIDVVAGVVLGVGSIYMADWIVDRMERRLGQSSGFEEDGVTSEVSD